MRIKLLLLTLCLMGGGCAQLIEPPVLIGAAGAEVAEHDSANGVAVMSVSAIAQHLQVRAIMQSIESMNALNIERLIAITEIPAPPFQEVERARDLADRFRALGLVEVRLDAVGNVLARRPGIGKDRRTLAVVAHLDTVFPPETDVRVRREGDNYYAPGIGDNSRGLVLLLSLLDALQTHAVNTRDDILFVGSVGEEGLGDLRGVRYLMRGHDPDIAGGSETGGLGEIEDDPDIGRAPNIDAFIAIDGGRPNRLINGAVGSNRYRVTFSGPGGHSYGAFGRAHPHQALANAIDRFTNSAKSIAKNDPKATFSVGRIGGGTSINSIPFESWMEVDMRSQDPIKLSALDRTFKKSVQKALDQENRRRSKGDALTVEINRVGQRPAGVTDPNSSLVRHASAAMRQLGLEPNLRSSSTDANIPMSLGIPAITLSRGGVSENAHAPNESWTNENSHLAIQVALLTVLAEAGLQLPTAD